MKLGLYRYGEATGLAGISLGIARQVPRGIRKEDYAAKGYFDVWVPQLAPSKKLYTSYRRGEMDFRTFAKEYRQEMKSPASQQTIQLVAAMAKEQQVNLGCFCEDEKRCHRSILAKLIQAAAAKSSHKPTGVHPQQFSSPPCSMPECEE